MIADSRAAQRDFCVRIRQSFCGCTCLLFSRLLVSEDSIANGRRRNSHSDNHHVSPSAYRSLGMDVPLQRRDTQVRSLITLKRAAERTFQEASVTRIFAAVHYSLGRQDRVWEKRKHAFGRTDSNRRGQARLRGAHYGRRSIGLGMTSMASGLRTESASRILIFRAAALFISPGWRFFRTPTADPTGSVYCSPPITMGPGASMCWSLIALTSRPGCHLGLL